MTELKEGAKLLVLAREFPTESGPIDALGVDSDGDIYVIETKLYKNPDKRLVIAQMLDYGAALWKGYQDFSQLTAAVESSGGSKLEAGLSKTLADCFTLNTEALELVLQRMRMSLLEGRFQFIVLMDHLEDRLRTLITFVNSNSNFRVLGCELEFYEHDGYEVLIPKLYGGETPARVTTTGGGSRRKWTREMFDAELAKTTPPERVSRLRDLIAVAERNPKLFLNPRLGTGLTGSLGYYDPSGYGFFRIYLSGKCELTRLNPEKVRAADVRQLIAKYGDQLHWRGEFEGEEMYCSMTLTPVESLSPAEFNALKTFLVEYASLAAG